MAGDLDGLGGGRQRVALAQRDQVGVARQAPRGPAWRLSDWPPRSLASPISAGIRCRRRGPAGQGSGHHLRPAGLRATEGGIAGRSPRHDFAGRSPRRDDAAGRLAETTPAAGGVCQLCPFASGRRCMPARSAQEDGDGAMDESMRRLAAGVGDDGREPGPPGVGLTLIPMGLRIPPNVAWGCAGVAPACVGLPDASWAAAAQGKPPRTDKPPRIASVPYRDIPAHGYWLPAPGSVTVSAGDRIRRRSVTAVARGTSSLHLDYRRQKTRNLTVKKN